MHFPRTFETHNNVDPDGNNATFTGECVGEFTCLRRVLVFLNLPVA
ncbi:MAG: hypothetical protein R3C99_18580 [Pirellulaceae bacterium]